MGDLVKEEKSVHTVFISDENFCVPTAVAIQSIAEHKEKDIPYVIHVLAVDISAESRDRLLAMNVPKFSIDLRDVKPRKEWEQLSIANFHVSTAALNKFNLGNEFSTLNKILYLDGDIIAQRGLSPLYNIDIDGVYAAAVKDAKAMRYKPPVNERLGVSKVEYFNSGVMLLNLKKIREDDIYSKLIDYRIHGKNFFMDQDALNVVFGEKVRYLPMQYNCMTSLAGVIPLEDLKQFYPLEEIKNKDEIYHQAYIFHLTTKYKPWLYYNVPFSVKWREYYLKVFPDRILERKQLDISLKINQFGDGRTRDDKDFTLPEVIISMASSPDRIANIAQILKTLLDQTQKADKIILWLAEHQFPNHESNLPEALVELSKTYSEIQIRWCDDLKSHNKYYYAMQENPNSVIITANDNMRYRNTTVEKLLDSYREFPNAVSAEVVHLIVADENNNILPYEKWIKETNGCINKPSMQLVPANEGCVLYPPHILPKETFNKKAIIENCLYADDLWLKAMEVVSGVPVVLTGPTEKPMYIGEAQVADSDNEKDKQFRDILHYLKSKLRKKDLEQKMAKGSSGENCEVIAGTQALIDHLVRDREVILNKTKKDTAFLQKKLKDANAEKKELKTQLNDANKTSRRLDKQLKDVNTANKNLEKQLADMRSGMSFKIGRIITYIPRKILGKK